MSGRGWSKMDRQSFADRDVLRASSVPSKRAQGPAADEWHEEVYLCEWVASCKNETDWTAYSAALGRWVPVCGRCAKRVDLGAADLEII